MRHGDHSGAHISATAWEKSIDSVGLPALNRPRDLTDFADDPATASTSCSKPRARLPRRSWRSISAISTHADKADGSPVTVADQRAEEIILDIPHADRHPGAGRGKRRGRASCRIWASGSFVVDPLDGTKEFLKRNGEFTVNIALVERGRPVLGRGAGAGDRARPLSAGPTARSRSTARNRAVAAPHQRRRPDEGRGVALARPCGAGRVLRDISRWSTTCRWARR